MISNLKKIYHTILVSKYVWHILNVFDYTLAFDYVKNDDKTWTANKVTIIKI